MKSLQEITDFMATQADELDKENVNTIDYMIARLGLEEDEFVEWLDFLTKHYYYALVRTGQVGTATIMAVNPDLFKQGLLTGFHAGVLFGSQLEDNLVDD